MKKIHFPGGLIISSGILNELHKYTSHYGKNHVFICGANALKATKTYIESSFSETDCTCVFITCGKIANLSEIERVLSLDILKDADVIYGVGGGSCMDIARTVGNRMSKKLVMIPTTASSDAPGSKVSVFYSEKGDAIVGDELYASAPDLIIVDSNIIANAPARHLASGMGDAVATLFEATTNINGANGKNITETAMVLSKLAYEIILRDGLSAYNAVKQHIVTPQLENVIEANCLLSGVGGLNTGCAAAHGIGDMLCSVPGCHNYMHGERVYVGLMVQLILEKYPEELLIKLMKFGREVSLPICLSDLGISDIPATAQELAANLQNDHFMINMICDYSENILKNAICYADSLAKTI